MSPYEINVLLHYHCHAHDYEDVERNPPVWRPTIEGLIRDGLIEKSTTANYRITEKGRFYVIEGLCQVPVPVQTWRF